MKRVCLLPAALRTSQSFLSQIAGKLDLEDRIIAVREGSSPSSPAAAALGRKEPQERSYSGFGSWGVTVSERKPRRPTSASTRKGRRTCGQNVSNRRIIQQSREARRVGKRNARRWISWTNFLSPVHIGPHVCSSLRSHACLPACCLLV